MYQQSRQALAHIDATLKEAGTDKSRILMAMVYIADMARKPEMNRAWDEMGGSPQISADARLHRRDARYRHAGRDRGDGGECRLVYSLSLRTRGEVHYARTSWRWKTT